MSPPVLLLMALVVGAVLIIFWRARILQYSSAEKQLQSWAKIDQTTAMLISFCRIVFKHGPGSQEAEAFKFNVGNKTVLENENEIGNEALYAFRVVTEVIENCLRESELFDKKNKEV